MIGLKKIVIIIMIVVTIQTGITGCGMTKSPEALTERDVPSCSAPPSDFQNNAIAELDISSPPIVAPIAAPLSDEDKMLLETYKFLQSYEGNRMQGAAYKFVRAYYLADIDAIKSMLVNPNDTELLSLLPDEKGTMDDVTWFVLKVYSHGYNKENGGETEYAHIQVEVKDMQGIAFFYFDIRMVYIDDDWKVVDLDFEM